VSHCHVGATHALMEKRVAELGIHILMNVSAHLVSMVLTALMQFRAGVHRVTMVAPAEILKCGTSISASVLVTRRVQIVKISSHAGAIRVTMVAPAEILKCRTSISASALETRRVQIVKISSHAGAIRVTMVAPAEILKCRTFISASALKTRRVQIVKISSHAGAIRATTVALAQKTMLLTRVIARRNGMEQTVN